MKLNKRNHTTNYTHMCTDCVFVFTVHSLVTKNKQLFCPSCGDCISVVPFVQTKKMTVRKPWTDEEFALIDRILAGELLKYQVAATTGRTWMAVQRKVEHRRKELNGIIKN